MLNLTKYKLPVCCELNRIQIDVGKLKEYYKSVETNFTDVFNSNKALCGIHHELTKSVYDNFKQISLTTISPELLNQQNKIADISCEAIEENVSDSKSASFRERYKSRKSMATGSTILNEHMYDCPTEYLKNTYVEEVLRQFKSIPTRVRLVKLDPNSTVPPHIDYDPTYAVRVIIPIVADSECVNLFWKKNELYSFNLEVGKAYFLNTGLRHAVVNFSKSPRVTLMISLKGQADIEHLSAEKYVQTV